MRLPLRSRLARVIGSGALVAAVLLPAAAPVAAADPLVLKLGTIENLRSLNPYQAAYFPDYEAFQLNYSLLTTIGPDLEIIPDFAESWSHNADGSGWTFKIRPGMKWSDGTPATAADACFSYGLVIDAINAGESVGNGYIDPALKDARVTKAECPDDETMILSTVDGTSKILKTSIPILPKHIFGKETYKTIGDAKFAAPLVGSGQYTVSEYTADETVHFVRNPNWYGQKGAADEIFIQIYKNVDTMVQDLKRGDIDYARGVPIEQFKQLQGQPNIQTVAGKLAGWVELGFNSYGTGTGNKIKGGGPSTTALLDPEFRSILGYAIDKQALLDKVHGGYGTVGSTQVPPVMENKEATPSFFWHTEPNNLRPFDIEMAKQKLTEAGYLLDATGQRLDKDQKPISLHLVMPDSDATYPQLAQFIQSWFAELGIKVKPDVVEENSLYDIMLPPEADPDNPDTYKADYDMFIWSWYETVEPNTLLQVFLCDQIGSSSDSLWCNKDYDALYEKQNLATDDVSRKAIIDEMQQMFYDQSPYQILYYDRELDAYRTDKFAGWQNQPRDEGYPLFSYSVINYQYLTDAKNPPASPSPAAPQASGGSAAPSAEAPASSPSASPGDNGSSTSDSSNTLLIVAAAVAAVAVVGGVVLARRRRTADEEE